MKKITFLFFYLFLSFGFFNITFAQDNKLPLLTAPDLKVLIPGMEPLQDIQCTEGTCNIPWLAQYIAGLQNYAIGVVGIIAVIALMIGGIVWLTAGGNNQKIEEAKKLISGSIIGVFLVLSAYSLLYIINPNLTVLKGLNINSLSRVNLPELLIDIYNSDTLSPEQVAILNSLDTQKLITHVSGISKNSYSSLSCNKSIFSGGQKIEFYATGYYKPGPWENTNKFFCAVGLNCTCPNGYTKDSTCGGNNVKCNFFSASTAYCNRNAAGTDPKIGEVAADLSCFNIGDQICLQGPGGKETLTIADTGGNIKGRRLDIFTGNNLKAALTSTGLANITFGPCN